MMSNLQQNNKFKDYWELSKPDITLLVIITAFFGYYAGIVSLDSNNGLNWMIEQIKKDRAYFKAQCQDFARNNFSSEIIAEKYVQIYKRVLQKV